MKEFTKTILIDMDNTIADLDGTVVQTLANEHPEIPKFSRKSFYINDDVSSDHKEHITNIISMPGFFLRLKVIEGSFEAWSTLIEKGYKPQICTAPLRKNRYSISDKLSWLEENLVPRFGYEVIDNAIIDKKKYLHPALALIDDRPEIEGSEKALWEHIVIDQSYNYNSKSQYRILRINDRALLPILGSIANRSQIIA